MGIETNVLFAKSLYVFLHNKIPSTLIDEYTALEFQIRKKVKEDIFVEGS